ncbi:MAG: DUF4369 domain-containing protein [Flavobacteriaceae bacterium]
MIRFVSFLLVLFTLLSCDSSAPKMKLSGTIDGLRKGTLLLQKIEDSVFKNIDSVTINGEAHFQFSVPIEEPEVYFLTMRFNDSLRTQRRLSFFAEPSEIVLHSKLKNFEIETSVKGSVNQEKWDAYSNLMRRYNDKNLELIEQHFNALKAGNDSLSMALKKDQEKLVSSRYLATVNFAKNNNDFEIAPYLMLTEVYDANVKYLDTIYKLLTPKIKDSKYGKALESLIKDRKGE